VGHMLVGFIQLAGRRRNSDATGVYGNHVGVDGTPRLLGRVSVFHSVPAAVASLPGNCTEWGGPGIVTFGRMCYLWHKNTLSALVASDRVIPSLLWWGGYLLGQSSVEKSIGLFYYLSFIAVHRCRSVADGRFKRVGEFVFA
jgi:hypothetical protein